MGKDPVGNIDVSKIAVALAAHGSPMASGKNVPTIKLQKNIEQMKIYSSVVCGFLEQEPKIGDVIKNIKETDIYVVPVMACKGYIADTKLPRALGLTGSTTEKIGANGRKRIHITDPVGINEDLPELALKMLLDSMKKMGISPNDASAIIVGHGSMQSRASFEQTNKIAMSINEIDQSLDVKAAFLEEPPRIGDWKKISKKNNVFILPIMISDGHHGRRDIPHEIGISTDNGFDEKLNSGVTGPYEIDGRSVFMLIPIGETKQISDIVISTIADAIKMGR